jgi:hypothetical protein
MATVLPFDKVVAGATTIDTDEFVSGRGMLSLKGDDGAVTTADGRIHNFRRTVVPETSFECHGDKSAMNGVAGLGVSIAVSRGATAIKSFTGIVSAKYSETSETTAVTIKGDPT